MAALSRRHSNLPFLYFQVLAGRRQESISAAMICWSELSVCEYPSLALKMESRESKDKQKPRMPMKHVKQSLSLWTRHDQKLTETRECAVI